ncbi:MAG: nicotinic acid mononucleotide adenyltransferase [Flavobacteriaceae bacterium]|nr:nicotinic acid mononucleotide adenyltransferase [Flavobacteriaceae bacterium]
MKYLKLAFGFAFVSLLFTSCVYDRDITLVEETENIESILYGKELWYVDIHATQGQGEVPFIQRAFTLSFLSNGISANNNLVGLGSNGNGFGYSIGDYNLYGKVLEVYHQDEGHWQLEVYPIHRGKIELYHRATDTSYYLLGYQRSNFDYDMLFYDNIHFLLQEYEVWEKTATSTAGMTNAFDAENLLQFFPENQGEFRSSKDVLKIGLSQAVWDYTGLYQVYDIANEAYVKTLTMDYDYLDNEYFEIDVLNDKSFELYHPKSGTTYRFEGHYGIAYAKKEENKRLGRKRKKIVNPVMDIKKKRQIEKD